MHLAQRGDSNGLGFKFRKGLGKTHTQFLLNRRLDLGKGEGRDRATT